MYRRLTLAALVTLAACGSSTEPSSPSSASVTGSYTMRSIYGQPLPYLLQNGLTKATITHDVLAVTDGGTWIETATYLLSTSGGPAQEQVIAAQGTYSRSGTAFTFYDPSDRSNSTATFTGSGFTFADSRVYSK